MHLAEEGEEVNLLHWALEHKLPLSYPELVLLCQQLDLPGSGRSRVELLRDLAAHAAGREDVEDFCQRVIQKDAAPAATGLDGLAEDPITAAAFEELAAEEPAEYADLGAVLRRRRAGGPARFSTRRRAEGAPVRPRRPGGARPSEAAETVEAMGLPESEDDDTAPLLPRLHVGGASSSAAAPPAAPLAADSPSPVAAPVPAAEAEALPARPGWKRGGAPERLWPTYNVHGEDGRLMGSLKWGEADRLIAAHCLCPAHGKLCRVNRTINESERVPGRGRPIGFLTVWIWRGPEHPDHASHHALSRGSSITLAERQRARAWAEAQPDLAPLLLCERPRRTGEGSEPEQAPR